MEQKNNKFAQLIQIKKILHENIQLTCLLLEAEYNAKKYRSLKTYKKKLHEANQSLIRVLKRYRG